VEPIFSIPDPSYSLVHGRALELGIRVVAPRHESAGVHMADGFNVFRMQGVLSIAAIPST
jgi:thiamine pyrophosphate-dependent acetolactate synthase large subunit-like protein